jgi:hypothetical protein
MTTPHWAIPYVGTPWAQTANCWDFFRRVQAEHFGIEVPEIHIEAFDLRHLIQTFRDHPERGNWQPIATADRREGDGILMAQRKRPWHVGVWVDVDGGRVMHCPEGGAVLQRLADVHRCGWEMIEFYRHTPA